MEEINKEVLLCVLESNAEKLTGAYSGFYFRSDAGIIEIHEYETWREDKTEESFLFFKWTGTVKVQYSIYFIKFQNKKYDVSKEEFDKIDNLVKEYRESKTLEELEKLCSK